MDFMPPNLISRLRPCGRAAVVIATVLMVAQAFLAGLAGAQAALVENPGASDIAVICHGGGGSPEGGTAPDTPEKQHPCCVLCTAGVGPAVLPTPALALLAGCRRAGGLPALHAVSIQIAPRAVRAGSSQAPPDSV
jgi:hypothetical protein